jgi:hypothetical protein
VGCNFEKRAEPRIVFVEGKIIGRRPSGRGAGARHRFRRTGRMLIFRWQNALNSENLHPCGFQPFEQLALKMQEKIMAERVGFEPTVGVNLHTLSKRAP